MTDAIKVDGLREFQRNLKKLDSDLPKVLRVAFNNAADVVVGDAKSRVPRRTGRAQATIKARSTQTSVRVTGGSNKVPYYAWLDFGGRTGRKRSVRRAFLKEGRYLYAAYFDRQPEFVGLLEKSLLEVVAQAGIGVD